jgi:hypothetical protein
MGDELPPVDRMKANKESLSAAVARSGRPPDAIRMQPIPDGWKEVGAG